MTPLAALIAVGIGLALGMLGGGGSIVAVPALTLLLHLPAKEAVATSLAVVGIAAAAGAIGALWRGVLPLSVAASIGASATGGALIGGRIGARLPDHVQLTALAILMFVAAVAMWKRPVLAAVRDEAVRTPMLMAIGVGVGLLTGAIGVGGGFLIVPALVLAAKLPMPKAAGASLFAIALAAVSAIPSYAGHAALRWSFIAPFAATAAVAAMLGGAAAHRVPHRLLQRAFAVTLVILGTYVLYQA